VQPPKTAGGPSTPLEDPLAALYGRLQQVRWSLLSKQRTLGQLVEQQRKRICEQERVILHLGRRLARAEGRAGPPRVEDLETLALSRLPRVEEAGEVTAPAEKGDGDSAIHLDSSCDSLRPAAPAAGRERPLQRSVSDVVGHRGRAGGLAGEGEPFSTPLYRGFLLRHQRRQKDYSPVLLQDSQQEPRGPDTVCVAVRQCSRASSVRGGGQTPRAVKARCRRQRTTIIINGEAAG
jgi:hypothetical protein